MGWGASKVRFKIYIHDFPSSNMWVSQNMNRSKQLLIRICLYIFKNTLLNIKILDKNIKKHNIIPCRDEQVKNAFSTVNNAFCIQDHSISSCYSRMHLYPWILYFRIYFYSKITKLMFKYMKWWSTRKVSIYTINKKIKFNELILIKSNICIWSIDQKELVLIYLNKINKICVATILNSNLLSPLQRTQECYRTRSERVLCLFVSTWVKKAEEVAGQFPYLCHVFGRIT